MTVSVVVTNRGRTVESATPNILFNLEDAAGHRFRLTIGSDMLEAPVGGLAVGQTVTGNVTFEVLDGTHGLVLVFQPGPFDQPVHIALD